MVTYVAMGGCTQSVSVIGTVRWHWVLPMDGTRGAEPSTVILEACRVLMGYWTQSVL